MCELDWPTLGVLSTEKSSEQLSMVKTKVKKWKKSDWEVVESSPLEMFNKRLDVTLSAEISLMRWRLVPGWTQ